MGTPGKVEIVVECTAGVRDDIGQLARFWQEMYEWLLAVELGMPVKVRLMPGEEASRMAMQPWYEGLAKRWKENRENAQLRKSGYEVGTWMEKEEYEES